MKVFFGSVVYPSMLPYLGDFIASLKKQVFRDYTLLIINDGVSEDLLEKELNCFDINFVIVNNHLKKSPPELRTWMLIEAKQRKCNLLVLGDSDDYFSANRVKRIAECATQNSNCTFFYNTIIRTDNQPVMPDLPERSINYESIADFNFLGMSNTAIRVDMLSVEFLMSLYECNQPIYDWYLFSRILINNNMGLFVKGCYTYYRFHENNTIGNQIRNVEAIQREVEVKLKHYNLLAKYSEDAASRYSMYNKDDYRLINTSMLYYWWNYTIGGKEK